MARLSRPTVRLFAASLVLSMAGAAVVARTQQPAAAPSDASPQRFGAATSAVLVDVVVRDKSGKPVTDLTAADFQLLEDDVPQDIASVTLVAPGTLPSGAPPTTAVAPSADTPRRTVETPTIVALAFDRLSPDGRDLAHKGAMAYLESARENDFAGVFAIDNSLSTIQTYTSDRALLRTAIDEVASRATVRFDRSSDRTHQTYDSTDPLIPPTVGAEERGPALFSTPSLPGGTGPAVAPPPGPGHTDVGGSMSENEFWRVLNRMDSGYQAMMRDQQGFASTNALLALVDSLSLLPGRKTVVYFAEGLAIPANVQERFESVVATANRANVSIYTVDAAGLRIHSTQGQTANDINAIGNAALERDPENPKGRLTEALERNEDALREDPAVSLGILADRTGGFLINNTNALEQGFRTIDADRRFHYLLTYAPKNDDFNGEWRRITVKVPTRKVDVRARSGYQAIRSVSAIPLLAYEAPAAAAFDRTPVPKELPLRAAAFSFPDAKRPGRLVVLAATDASALQVNTTPQSYATDFTILTRLKDAQGQVVRKASQPYKLTGPVDKVDAVKHGDVLFFRQPDVPPGTYTLESVVHDALAKKDAVTTVPVTVPEVKPGQLLVSSLVIVRRTEKVPAAERTGDNPLYIGELLAYPNLGEPLRKSVDKTLSFFLDVQPAGGGASPTATLELLADGNPLAQAPLQLPAAGADGRIQETAQLPLANFPAGAYVLRITIAQGSAQEARETKFTVID